MWLRVAIGVLSVIVLAPAIVQILRSRRRLHSPDATILVYRTWEGQ